MTIKLQSYVKQELLAAKRTFYRHTLLWAAFITYETGTLFLSGNLHGKPMHYLLFYSLNIGFFYTNALFILPLACRRPKKTLITPILLVISECVAYLAIKWGLDYTLAMLNHTPHDELLYTKIYLVGNLWRCMNFLAFSSVYYALLSNERYYRRLIAARAKQNAFYLEKAQLEMRYSEMQNAYLEQQIHPHFLFNTLNFIYSSFYQLSDSAANCVGKLTDIFRYSLKGTGPDGKAELRAEIEQIQNFIEINRLRFAHPIYIDLEVIGNIMDQRIIPLVLLSFVENIFKYGTIKEKLWPVQIVIEVTAFNLLIFTCNNLKNNKPTDHEQNKTIGLDNTAKRLNFSYPNKYQLDIKDEEDTFGIALQIYL